MMIIAAINKLSGKKTMTERSVCKIMQVKKTIEVVIFYLFLNKNVFTSKKVCLFYCACVSRKRSHKDTSWVSWLLYKIDATYYDVSLGPT